MKSSYTEDDVQFVFNDIVNRKSRRKASLDWGVLRTTLRNRITSAVSRPEAYTPSQRLSPVQEQRLTDWVLVQESLGLNPTYAQIRAFSGRILAARHNTTSLGKRWIAGFLRRNSVLKTKK